MLVIALLVLIVCILLFGATRVRGALGPVLGFALTLAGVFAFCFVTFLTVAWIGLPSWSSMMIVTAIVSAVLFLGGRIEKEEEEAKRRVEDANAAYREAKARSDELKQIQVEEEERNRAKVLARISNRHRKPS